MPEPVKITDEMVKAFVDSYEEGCCNDSSADWCCTRHALARVAPLIAAQALRAAAGLVEAQCPTPGDEHVGHDCDYRHAAVLLRRTADAADRAAREEARRAE